MNILALDHKNITSEEQATPKIFQNFQIPKTDKNSIFQAKLRF